MDNVVSAKFFIVSPTGGSPFIDALSDIFAKGLADRERDLNVTGKGSLVVRLEQLDLTDKAFVSGELVRKQVDNIPPEATDDGLTPIELSDGGGLAYSSAFCYHRETRCLVIQSNPIAVTQTRLAAYLSAFDAADEYDFDPVVRRDSWNRFNRGAPRKLAIRIASPNAGIPALEDEADTVAGSMANVAEALGAAYITIEVSMGTKQGGLAKKAVKSVLEAFKKKRDAREIDVRMLHASIKDDVEGTDVIDFLEEHLIFRETFQLPSDDVEKNYKLRSDALKGTLKAHLDYIKQHYGPKAR